MKKVIALLLSLSFVVLLFGCTRLPEKPSFEEAATMVVSKPTTTAAKKEESRTINLVAEKNSAAIGMVYLFDSVDNKKSVGDYKYEIVDDTKDIAEKLVSGEIDIAAVTTTDALKIYKENKGKVQVIAISSFSNLYLVELGEVSISAKDFSGFNGKFYCGFDSISVPVMNYIFKANDLSITANTDYSDKAIADLVEKGRVLHCALPEPLASTSAAKNSNENVGLDVSDLWEAAIKGTDFENSKICSTVLIANADFAASHPKAVSTFIKEYKSSEKNVSSQTTAPDLLVKFELAATVDEAKEVIPGSSLTCKYGEDMKTILGEFLGALNSFDQSIVVPEDDFYYISK